MHEQLLQKFVNLSEDHKTDRRILSTRMTKFLENQAFKDLFTDDIYTFFVNKSSISKTRFYVLRNTLKLYIEFLCENGVISFTQQAQYVQFVEGIKFKDVVNKVSNDCAYYKNLSEVLDLLERAITSYQLNISDAYPAQSIAIVLWNGLSVIEILNLLKTDIDVENSCIYCSGKKYILSKQEIMVLHNFSLLNYYRLISGSVSRFKTTDKLFKVDRADTLSQWISHIDDLMYQHYQKRFSGRILNKNRIFTELFKNEKQGLHCNIRQMLMNTYHITDKNTITAWLIEYDKWKQKFMLS